MTKEEKDLLLAFTLGDGYVRLNGRNKKSGLLQIVHSTKQRMYIEWKAKKLESIFKKPIKIHNYNSKFNGKSYDSLFIFKSHKYFRVLRNYLYKNGEKRITPTAIKRLSPLGLAILYLDDGSLLRRTHGIAIRLHLSLYKHEINPILDVFKQKWGIEFKAYRENSKKELYLLYANTVNSFKFLDIVKDIVLTEIGCMRYKVDA